MYMYIYIYVCIQLPDTYMLYEYINVPLIKMILYDAMNHFLGRRHPDCPFVNHSQPRHAILEFQLGSCGALGVAQGTAQSHGEEGENQWVLAHKLHLRL